MLEKVAPYLASIGVHKNGTWAAQKIIDKSTTDKQVIIFDPIYIFTAFETNVFQFRLPSFVHTWQSMSQHYSWTNLATTLCNAAYHLDQDVINLSTMQSLIVAGR